MLDQIKRALEAQIKLCEAAAWDMTPWGYIDPRDLGIGDQPGFMPPGGPFGGQAFLDRRRKGEYLPAYLTSEQLAIYRRRIRALVINNEIALNAVNQRINYSVGTGLAYDVTSRPKMNAPQWLIDDVQAVVDAFCEFNELDLREGELVSRIDIEGESIMRLFRQRGGLLAVRQVEPEQLKAPSNAREEDSFGIRTHPRDLETIEGYWIADDASSTPEFIPADEVFHVKHPETPSTSKRGLSAFYPIETTLRAVEDLLISTVTMAKTRAKIALLRKLQGTTGSLAQALISSQTSATITDPQSGQTATLERLPYASILTMPETVDLEMPSQNIAASDHAEVMAMVLRIIASRFSMPEFLLSSDASNANYSNTMVAESGFVKSMERFQAYLSRRLTKNRFPGSKQSLLWRAVYWAIESGMLPKETPRLVDIVATGPSLVVRDTSKEAQVDKIYHEMKVKSIRTIQLEQGLDPENEAAEFAKEKPDPQQQPQPPMLEAEKKDKRGHRYCTDDNTGKRVKCGPAQDSPAEPPSKPAKANEPAKPASPSAKFANAQDAVKEIKGTKEIKPGDVDALADRLMGLTVKELGEVKKVFAAKIKSTRKLEIAKELADKLLAGKPIAAAKPPVDIPADDKATEPVAEKPQATEPETKPQAAENPQEDIPASKPVADGASSKPQKQLPAGWIGETLQKALDAGKSTKDAAKVVFQTALDRNALPELLKSVGLEPSGILEIDLSLIPDMMAKLNELLGGEPAKAPNQSAEPTSSVPGSSHKRYSVDIKKRSDSLTSKYGKRVQAKATAAELASLKEYTGDAYLRMNQLLRGDKIPDADKKETQARIDHLNSLMTKAGKLDKPETVYRGMSLSESNSTLQGLLQAAQSQSDLAMDGFISTSINPTMASEWAFVQSTEKEDGAVLVLLEIKAKQGIWAKPFAAQASEEEMVLPHGMKYRVVGVEEETYMGEFMGEKFPKKQLVFKLEML